jgi:hypothetical protein
MLLSAVGRVPDAAFPESKNARGGQRAYRRRASALKVWCEAGRSPAGTMNRR